MSTSLRTCAGLCLGDLMHLMVDPFLLLFFLFFFFFLFFRGGSRCSPTDTSGPRSTVPVCDTFLVADFSGVPVLGLLLSKRRLGQMLVISVIFGGTKVRSAVEPYAGARCSPTDTSRLRFIVPGVWGLSGSRLLQRTSRVCFC